jgi:hypothetical protein
MGKGSKKDAGDEERERDDEIENEIVTSEM